MSEDQQKKKKEFKLSDQVIGQLRELLQLSMLSGTSFVDHCRSLRLEESSQNEGTMILSKTYVEGWNAMATKMYEEAQEKATKMASTMVEDPTEPEDEILISRDPVTGKLVGKKQKIQN